MRVHHTRLLDCTEWMPLKLLHVLRSLTDLFGVIRNIEVVLDGLVLMKVSPSIL